MGKVYLKCITFEKKKKRRTYEMIPKSFTNECFGTEYPTSTIGIKIQEQHLMSDNA